MKSIAFLYQHYQNFVSVSLRNPESITLASGNCGKIEQQNTRAMLVMNQEITEEN